MKLDENMKYIITGGVALAIICLIAYLIPGTVMTILFISLLVVVCWNLGIIVQDILGHAKTRN